MARTRRAPHRNKLIVKVVQYTLMGIFSVFLIFLIGQRVYVFIKKADIFQIREVVVSPDLGFIEKRHFSALKGHSIFDVSLNALYVRLKTLYPQMDQLRIVRKFPDTIMISAKRRDPVLMLIQGDREIFIDSEGVVVSKGNSSGLTLPVVIGLRSFPETRTGQNIKARDMTLALDVLHAFQSREPLRPFNIASIDVGNFSKVTVLLNNGLQVFVDSGKIDKNAQQLAVVLSQESLDLNTLEYIDLRFKEPVLGQKQNGAKAGLSMSSSQNP